MKKLLYIPILFAVLFASCDPMDDINDNIADDTVVKSLSYTLTDDDYSSMGLSYSDFSSYDPASEYLPDFLADKYPTLDVGSSVNVTYNYYKSVSVDSTGAYVIGDDVDGEYQTMGQAYDNFEDEDVAEASILKLFNSYGEYALVDSSAEMTVKYTLYSSMDTRYFYVDADYTVTLLDDEPDSYYTLTSDDYKEKLGQNYNDFSYVSSAEYYLGVLAQMDGYGPGYYACDIYQNYYDRYFVIGFDGTEWTAKSSITVMTEQYILNDTAWKSDATVSYTMTGDDYQTVVTYVEENLGESYMDSYGTAEYYFGSSAYYDEFALGNYDSSAFSSWQDAVSTAIATVTLPDLYPNAAVDSKYKIYFEGYQSSMVTYSMKFTCTGSGTFEYVDDSVTNEE